MSLQLYVPTEDDLLEVADNLRDADRVELRRQTGSTNYRAILQNCVGVSPDAMLAVDQYGGAAALFGCAPIGGLVSAYGSPWCIGTDRLARQPRALMSVSRAYVPQWQVRYPHLVNWVDAENELSIKYLAALGFAFDPPAPHGAEGALFHRFHMEGVA